MARKLWVGEPTSFQGRFTQLDEVTISPTPPRADGIPVVVGGNSAPAARRAGRIGDGWMTVKLDASELAEVIPVMRQAAVEAGRDPDTIEITHGIPPGSDLYERVLKGCGELDRFAEAGVSRIVLMPPAMTVQEGPAALENMAETLLDPR